LDLQLANKNAICWVKMKRMLMYKKNFGTEATDLGIKGSERSSGKKVKALKVPNCEMQCLDSWYMRRGLNMKRKKFERAGRRR